MSSLMSSRDAPMAPHLFKWEAWPNLESFLLQSMPQSLSWALTSSTRFVERPLVCTVSTLETFVSGQVPIICEPDSSRKQRQMEILLDFLSRVSTYGRGKREFT